MYRRSCETVIIRNVDVNMHLRKANP